MRHSPLVLLAIAGLSAPIAAQAPQRVMGAQYHNASRAYIDLMIPHHQMALMMSEHHLPMLRSDSAKALARRIIDTQKREIAELKEARKALFGSDSVRQPAMQDMMQMMTAMHGDSAKRMMDMRHENMGKAAMPDSMRRTMPPQPSDATTRMHQGAAPPSPRPMSSMTPGTHASMSPGMSGDMDRMFLEHMLQHHEEGADLSVLAEDSQAAARVQQLALKIRQGQERDIADMRRLLAGMPKPETAAHKH